MLGSKLGSPLQTRGTTASKADATALEAEHVVDANYEVISVSDSDGGELLDREESEVVCTETEDEALPASSVGPEDERPMTHERRLTIKQMERFRQAIQKSKSRKSGRRGFAWSAKTQSHGGHHSDDQQFDNLFGNQTISGRELRVVTYPWPIWIFGFLVMLASVIFAHRVHTTSVTPEHKDDWWKYLVAVVVFFVALGLVANGRIESFCMTRDTGRLMICSTKAIFLAWPQLRRERVVDRDLRHIASIRVEASGEFSGDVDTRSYKVHFEFDDGSHASALESRSKKKTLRRCRMITAFAASCVPVVAPRRSSVPKAPAVVPLPRASAPTLTTTNSTSFGAS